MFTKLVFNRMRLLKSNHMKEAKKKSNCFRLNLAANSCVIILNFDHFAGNLYVRMSLENQKIETNLSISTNVII